MISVKYINNILDSIVTSLYNYNDNIQYVTSIYNERKIFEEGHNDLTTYYFI